MRNTLEALERNLNESSELRLVLETLDLYFRAPRRAGPQPVIPEADIEAVMGGGAVGFVSSACRSAHYVVSECSLVS